MKRGKINLKFLQYPGKIVDVDLTWAYTVVFILATLFDHGNKYNTVMLIPWLHIKPGEWEFMTTQMSIQVTWGLSVVVMVVDRVPSLPGVIVPVQVTVRPPQVDQVLKQTHTGERTIRSTGRVLCLVRGIEVLHRRGWPFIQLLVWFAKVYQILKKIKVTHIKVTF